MQPSNGVSRLSGPYRASTEATAREGSDISPEDLIATGIGKRLELCRLCWREVLGAHTTEGLDFLCEALRRVHEVVAAAHAE